MKKISIGKLRGLQQCSSPRRTFTCLALDHRQNLRKINPAFQDNYQLSEYKLSVARNLSDYATSVLFDPEVSASQAIATMVLPGEKGLIVAVESTGYEGESNSRRTQILPGWSVDKAKRMGASLVKLLVYYHPYSKTAQETENTIKNVASDCQRHDIGLMLEPLSYSLSTEKLTGEEKRFVVVETAKRLTNIPGVDILKAELPMDVHEKDKILLSLACREISAVSTIPWVLLSASVPFEDFLDHATIACKAGASGIAVGRAVWQETIMMNTRERATFLETIGKERLASLYSICLENAKPWTDWYYAEADFDWYLRY